MAFRCTLNKLILYYNLHVFRQYRHAGVWITKTEQQKQLIIWSIVIFSGHLGAVETREYNIDISS